MKLTTLTQTIAEIDSFVGEVMSDDNQIVSEHKTAQKKADRLQTNLQSACNELSALTVIADESSPTSHSATSSLVASLHSLRKPEIMKRLGTKCQI